MLKKRLIPILLLKNGRMVKTIQFDRLRDVGHPITAAKIYDAQGADELVFLDITASAEQRSALLETIAAVAEECFMPLCAGGGVRSIEDIRLLLSYGADKVSINTRAVEDPGFINEAARIFGSANIVVSIDSRRTAAGGHEVFTYGGKKPTGMDAIAWARTATERGAGEILITSIDCEGMMRGYDLDLVSRVCAAVTVPVIAHGGAGTLKDFTDVITIGHASAAAAASIFHFTDQNLIKSRTAMKQAGLDVRPIV